MKIKFIQHASIIIDCGKNKILCDPWFTGTAFNDGWKSIHDSEVNINDLDFNYIWFSHEHPDHFSVPDLKKLKRKDIKILYQETIDNKVRDYCTNAGFEVIELKPFEKTKLDDDLVIVNGTDGFDSWLYVKNNGKTLLNLNDCRLDGEEVLSDVRTKLGKIDTLLTQYGYACWAGNDGDEKGPKIARKIIKSQLQNQISILQPNSIIPYASFIYFCHEENAYWNKNAITITEAYEFMSEMHKNIHVLYPNDEYKIGESWDKNKKNIDLYEKDFQNSLNKPKYTSISYNLSDLEESFQKMVIKLKTNNDWDSILDIGLAPAIVRLKDTGITVIFDITSDSLQITNLPWDIEMSSDSLKYMMDFAWGRGTVMINGRLKAKYNKIDNFWKQTMIYYANNIGKSYPKTLSKDNVLKNSNFQLELMREWEL